MINSAIFYFFYLWKTGAGPVWQIHVFVLPDLPNDQSVVVLL